MFIKKILLKKRLLPSITGKTDDDWKTKLSEINKRKIKKIALFLEQFNKKQRKQIYQALLQSKIKKIPLVHLKNDMTSRELEFLIKNFKSKYLTIHESTFSILKKWKGLYKKLYLELNKDNYIPKNVDVTKIGGFCVDLSHFKSAEESFTKEFLYIIKRRKTRKYFKCNHLNGYSYKKNTDIHTLKNKNQLNYLTTLPDFIFGKTIGLEMENSIKEQLRYKDYIIKLLTKSKIKK